MDAHATVLGWDPGTSGAACVHLLDSRGQIQSTESVRFSKATDSDVLEFLQEFAPTFAVLEKVGAGSFGKGKDGKQRKMGAVSAFKFGGAYRWAQGMMLALAIPYEITTPQKWQGGFNVPPSKGAQRKRELRAISQRMFPAKKIVLEDADSLLIAEYARRLLVSRSVMRE